MKKLLLVVGLLGILLTTAFGQEKFLQTKIPFEFVVGGQTFPAGDYDFKVSDHLLQMNNRDTHRTVQLLVMTRIAADDTAKGTARISFDVKEGKRYIEAVWPWEGDGYLLHTVKGEHTHETVRSQ